MTERISGTSAVSSAWNIFKKNWKFIIPAVIVTGIVYAILQVLQTSVQERAFPSLIIALIATIIGIALSLAWSQIVLKLIKGNHNGWNDFKTNPKTWFSYFVARLISGLFMFLAILVFGLPILLVIGSVIAASIPLMIIGIILSLTGIVLFVWISVRYMMISFVSIDHPHMGGWSLMKESARLTKGHIVELFLFGLLLLLVNIIGLIALVVGLLVSIPLSKIATGYVYEHLKGKHHTHAQEN
ncbi:MAG TPA: DUF975 family protein [Candidatus Paceibacterota bacterium]|jgi:hypothetical protein|nr:DUF975 family protein [Candidatus Paceibacterota bacterium]